MPIATDQQLQGIADTRVRTFAEKMRNLFALGRDHKDSLDDGYARAVQNPGTRWNDNRADPPHKLQSGFDGTTPASPDDILNFNSFLDRLQKFETGTFASLQEANEAAAMWAVLKDACVNPIPVQV